VATARASQKWGSSGRSKLKNWYRKMERLRRAGHRFSQQALRKQSATNGIAAQTLEAVAPRKIVSFPESDLIGRASKIVRAEANKSLNQ
jgi:hypothetical protein